jgi:signal transduction histidine kinase
VHREAVRLAAHQARLRGNLSAVFVNLSRRSQMLAERQLGIIESLEQSEQDPDRLSGLFRLDHLATRMRRNSENLLVLGGHEDPRKWSQPVPLLDVVRAAISEIEQYERIAVKIQPGVLITGRAASDVVHLAAELIENATAFSSAQVLVTAGMLNSGGGLIEITDEGLGIADQDLARANRQLDHPPVIDVGVSRRMGLFVVGRLAARHGIRVRLKHAQPRGLSALVWLPVPVAAHPAETGWFRRSDLPNANLLHGSRDRADSRHDERQGRLAESGQQAAIAHRRSPGEVRSRVSEFQHGARRGRSDAPQNSGAGEK